MSKSKMSVSHLAPIPIQPNISSHIFNLSPTNGSGKDLNNMIVKESGWMYPVARIILYTEATAVLVGVLAGWHYH